MVRCSVVILLLSSISIPAVGQASLRFDGETAVQTAIGSGVQIDLTGAPNEAAFLLADTSPGPSMVLGELVELGFTEDFVVALTTTMPPSGTLTLPAAVPSQSALVGLTLYFLGVVVDPSQPIGLAFSNGASMEFVDPTDFTEVELAGVELSAFPDFTHVRTFNAGSDIRAGVDTAQHPFLIGKTADVYLVSSKTTAEWAADAGLSDVSCDGADRVTFTSAGIAANQLVVDAGCAAPANAPLVGEGYDVVIDVDRDGMLSPGDFIDGHDDGEAGCYVVTDLAAPGPLPVIELNYGSGFTAQNLFYPANISQLGAQPLVIVSHGNGHNFNWYDHIGRHLASWGYIVMSHANNTMPGVVAAAATTLSNTDFFLGNLASIASGVLQGHVDSHRMTWIGHSRGGEGVTIAYRQVVTGQVNPANFTAADVQLISSIAPTTFMGPSVSNPGAVDFHLWVGSADSDVNGCPGSPVALSYPLLNRATRQRQSITLQGVGHGRFHNSAAAQASTGPCLLSQAETHEIMLPYLLALVEHHIRGNPATTDFLVREWETFRAPGSPTTPCAVNNLTFQADPASPSVLIVDDYQSQSSTTTASSGATVSFDVSGVTEGRLRDTNGNMTNNPSEPFNGFTQASPSDNPRGVVFDYAGASAFYRFDLAGGPVDLTGFDALTFRAAQAPRHPRTTAELAQVTFEVRLEDVQGRTSTISIGAYGGGIAEPYQRTGCGSGAGWAAEFETMRMPLRDFVRGPAALDLGAITSLTFLFGANHGSLQARLGLDHVTFVTE